MKKAPIAKLPDIPPSVFEKTVRLRTNEKPHVLQLKPEKRDNIFSQSRDTREDRGTRQMKSHNAQTFGHGH
jgi:hypothetical protein